MSGRPGQTGMVVVVDRAAGRGLVEVGVDDGGAVDDDRDVPAIQAQQLFAAAGEPKELWIVPNAGHRRIEEIASAEYRKRVLDFLDRLFPR